MKKVFTLCIILMTVVGISAKKRFPKEFLKSSADSVYVNIEEMHPNMFATYPKDKWLSNLEEAKKQFKDSMTIFDFYKIIAPLVSDLGDGHTQLYFPLGKLKESKIKIFPYQVRIDKKNYSIAVDDPVSGNIIPDGVIIDAINGIKSREIIQNLLPLVSGEKESFRLSVIEKQFSPMLYTMIQDSVFEVHYTLKNKSYEKYIDGVLTENVNQRSKNIVNYTLTMNKDKNYALIRFDVFDDIDKFKQFADSAFTEIQKQDIKNLIIDIRNNGGGNSIIADEMFQYISPVPFMQFGKVTYRISKRMRRASNWNPDEADGLHTEEVTELVPLRNNPLRFEGNVYLLTSGFTFSSATDFAWTFQYFNMGKIVGEETGGLIVCFGDSFGFNLPDMGLSGGVSWKKFYLYGSDDSDTHGVIPDYKVDAKDALKFVINQIDN